MSQLEENTATIQSIIEKISTKITPELSGQGYVVPPSNNIDGDIETLEFECETIDNLMGWIVWNDTAIQSAEGDDDYIVSIIWTSNEPDRYRYQYLTDACKVSEGSKLNAFTVKFFDTSKEIRITMNVDVTGLKSFSEDDSYWFMPFYSK